MKNTKTEKLTRWYGHFYRGLPEIPCFAYATFGEARSLDEMSCEEVTLRHTSFCLLCSCCTSMFCLSLLSPIITYPIAAFMDCGEVIQDNLENDQNHEQANLDSTTLNKNQSYGAIR